MLSARRDRHELVSASLAARDDGELAALLHDASGGAVGVGGGASVLDVDGVRVFAKRIPITERELAHPHSTANLFDLPTFCQYGMYRLAGPGFGAWRELGANLSLTEGVLGGESEAFALMHHWRVLPGRPPVASEHQDIEAVVAQFGGDSAVRVRLEELADARSSLVLFLEHLPDRLSECLNDPLASAEAVERQIFDAVAFCAAARCSTWTDTSATCARTTTRSTSSISGWPRRPGSTSPTTSGSSSPGTSTTTPTTRRCDW